MKKDSNKKDDSSISKLSNNHVKKSDGYDLFYGNIAELLQESRRLVVRTVNAIMTATYWEIGRNIVENEQGGAERAVYGEQTLKRLSDDLLVQFGKGFSYRNLRQMRQFYQTYSFEKIWQTVSAKSHEYDLFADLGARERLQKLQELFPLSWSQYVELLSIENDDERNFYEEAILQGGWSLRQYRRQKGSQFFQRVLLSKNKAAMLDKADKLKPEDSMSPEEQIKDSFVLEFLGLKNEYAESELEDALIQHLETFLLELGEEWSFVGRQKRMRVDGSWYQVDLVFFHRRLRSLVLIDLKLDKLTPGDMGQMLFYCGYARHHWSMSGENPPIGLILCAESGNSLPRYTLDMVKDEGKVLTAEYKTELPDPELLEAELRKTRKILEERNSKKSECDLEDEAE
jgi:predicted nuclease of restriction endonuclease-like (RecB) superfamily